MLWETAREMAKSGLNKSEKLMLDSGRFSDSIKSVTEDAKLAKYGRDQKRIGKKAIKDRYANVVDIAVGHSPIITALVWPSVWLIIQIEKLKSVKFIIRC